MSFGRVGEREKRGRWEIGEHEGNAPCNKPVQRGGRVVARPQGDVLDRKGLTEEMSGCIIVFNGKLGTGDAIVGGWNIENRERLSHVWRANEAYLDGDVVRRDRGNGDCRKRHGAKGGKNAILEDHAGMMVRSDRLIKGPNQGLAHQDLIPRLARAAFLATPPRH